MTTEENRVPLSSEVKRLESEVGPHAHHPLPHLRVFEQLKQRNVIRVAVLYLVVCWLILDPVHVVFHMLDVPIWADRLVIMLMAVGFPAVLIFAWVYEITPEGLKPTVEVPHGESIRRHTGRRLDKAIIAVLAVALGYFVLDKFWLSKRIAATAPAPAAVSAAPGAAAAAGTAPFSPPPHSIAVLPFINLSGDQTQEYFSDGLTEELLNSLAEINGLQVAARTSAFSFKGKDNDIGSIARKLNVAAILEGSVRRSEHTVRVTAQLINAVTGFHLWSKTYDRDLGDVLKLQTEIADAVAGALKVTLLGDEAAKIELGGTHNPAAFDAYLHGAKLMASHHGEASWQGAIDAFSEAIRLDPSYARAYAGRAQAFAGYAAEVANSAAAIHDNFSKAERDARQALALAPDLAEAHGALAEFYDTGSLDFAHAQTEYMLAVALDPGNARLQSRYGRFTAYTGQVETGIAAARKAVTLDPLNPASHNSLAQTLFYSRRYREAVGNFDSVLALDPEFQGTAGFRGLAYLALGDFEAARSSCAARPDDWVSQTCLAIAYARLGRQADAQTTLARLTDANGDTAAYQYAEIHAQWGDRPKALEWLETAVRVRDPGLVQLKMDPLMDPLRDEPRFQAVLRSLNFPG